MSQIRVVLSFFYNPARSTIVWSEWFLSLWSGIVPMEVWMSDNPEANGFEISNFAELERDPSRIAYFQSYFDLHYNDTFRYHQGTEEILGLLTQYRPAGDWIDLGSGPSTLFWSLALSGVHSITCSDIAPEALQVLHNFVCSDEIPSCYHEVLSMLSRPITHLADMRQRVRHYYVLDVMRPWPNFMRDRQYDLTTQFGTFGLASSPEEYLNCFAHLYSHIKLEGYVVGANWIRSPRLVTCEGRDNSYLSLDLVEHAATRFNFHLLYRNFVSIRDDDSYKAVIIWALKKRS